MKELFRKKNYGKDIVIRSGYKYLYARGLKYLKDDDFNDYTDWESWYNSDCAYWDVFLHYILPEKGVKCNV
jgi:hypothetical protein